MATLRTRPGERGSGESVEWSGEDLINRLFSHRHQTQQQEDCFPLLRGELKTAQGGHALEWQFPVPKPAVPCLPTHSRTGQGRDRKLQRSPYSHLIMRTGQTGAGRYAGVEAQLEEQTHPALTKDRRHFKE